MKYITPTGDEIEFKMKDMNTARARRDSYILLRDINDIVRKHTKDGVTDEISVYIDFYYPEVDGKVECRFKDIFDNMLEGELDKISYDLTDENELRLKTLANEVLADFFHRINASKPT